MNKYFREIKPNSFTITIKPILNFPSHLHEDVELIYCISGGGIASCEARQYNLTPGSFFLVFPNQIHNFEKCDPNGLYVCLIFKASMLLQYCECFTDLIPDSSIYYHPKDDPDNLLKLLQFLINEKSTCSNDVLQTYLTLISVKLLKHYKLHKKNIVTDSVSEIISYCSQHYTEQISITSVAKALNFSKSYVSYIFNKRLFIHFNEYINSLRISKALNLLEISKFSITDIAYLVGFSTSRTFNRTFLGRVGKTPSQYRKELRTEGKESYVEPIITVSNEIFSDL